MGRTKNDAAPDVAALVGDMPDGPGEVVPGLVERQNEALERENQELRRKLHDADKFVRPQALAAARTSAPRPFVPKLSRQMTPLGPNFKDGRGNTIVVGEGPYLWRGSLPGDSTAMICTFRSHTESDRAAVAEEYLAHAGYTATEHPIRVERLNDPALAREMAGA